LTSAEERCASRFTERAMRQRDVQDAIELQRDLRTLKVFRRGFKGPHVRTRSHAGGQRWKKIAEIGASMNDIAIGAMCSQEGKGIRFPNLTI